METMGHIWIDVDLSDLAKTKTRRVRGLVDTGASLTTIPKTLATELGIEVTSRSLVQTGAGRIEIERGSARVGVAGEEDLQTVWISEIIDKVLVGCVTLEMLGLKVDPTTGGIESAPLLLYPLPRE
ncbi:MAG: retroviral-like aspartic protease family protein [Deltaproteobacteria bacterium]|nr:retroviral-like aspartic protease family protein [Deltaproteobacteria bacterium]